MHVLHFVMKLFALSSDVHIGTCVYNSSNMIHLENFLDTHHDILSFTNTTPSDDLDWISDGDIFISS